jgi:hypothetical protein
MLPRLFEQMLDPFFCGMQTRPDWQSVVTLHSAPWPARLAFELQEQASATRTVRAATAGEPKVKDRKRTLKRYGRCSARQGLTPFGS